MNNFNIKDYPNAVLIDHPLLTHKITRLRNKNTKTNEFKNLVKEISILEGYEALRHLPTHDVEIETNVSGKLSFLYVGATGTKTYEKHFKHSLYPIELMFADTDVGTPSSYKIYITQTHADNILKNKYNNQFVS